MKKKKKGRVKTKKVKVVETPVIDEIKEELITEAPKVEVATEESTAKKEFRTFIEKLKEERPNAYLKNETELLSKLNNL